MVEHRRLRTPVERQTALLPTPISSDEALAHAARASDLQAQITDREAALKAYSKAAKAEIEEMARERNDVLRRVRDRLEVRRVDVEIHYLFSENTIRTIRLDTGEVTGERAMTHDERQARLFDIDSASERNDTPQEGRRRAAWADPTSEDPEA